MKKIFAILTMSILLISATPSFAEHSNHSNHSESAATEEKTSDTKTKHNMMDHKMHGMDKHEKNKEMHATKKGDAIVKANGLVCDFCARALEKVFKKQSEVKDINVDLTTKNITIFFNEGKTLSEEKIKEFIKDAGYDVEEVKYVE